MVGTRIANSDPWLYYMVRRLQQLQCQSRWFPRKVYQKDLQLSDCDRAKMPQLHAMINKLFNRVTQRERRQHSDGMGSRAALTRCLRSFSFRSDANVTLLSHHTPKPQGAWVRVSIPTRRFCQFSLFVRPWFACTVCAGSLPGSSPLVSVVVLLVEG